MCAKNNDYTTIFADDNIVVLNKRSGILIAADRYNEDAPRLDLLAEKEFGKLYAVHRIDKDTSGLIVYARTSEAHKNLSQQFEKRLVHKTYHALVYGHPLWDKLNVDLPLLPDGDIRHRTVVNKKYGKPSVTDFYNVGSCGPYSWIIAEPKTGRTHQIRAHFQYIKHPIFGDKTYGGDTIVKGTTFTKYKQFVNNCLEIVPRQSLHAKTLGFLHPTKNEFMQFDSELPDDIASVLNKWRRYIGDN